MSSLTHFSKHQSISLTLSVVSIFFVWIIFSILYGERIPAGNGLGFDGVNYTYYAQNFYELILNHKFTEYASQRIFVPFLIHGTSTLFNLPITEQNSPFYFQ